VIPHSIFSGNVAPVRPADPRPSSSIIKGGYPGRRIRNVDPRFAGAPGGDYRLAFGWPAIDASD
jgi:hypothetical protein